LCFFFPFVFVGGVVIIFVFFVIFVCFFVYVYF
jgi:hypothetical protein